MPERIPSLRLPRLPSAQRAADHAVYNSRAWARVRLEVLTRDRWVCRACGRQCGIAPRDAHVDHIVPMSQGGETDPASCQTLCSPCHARKTREQRKSRVT